MGAHAGPDINEDGLVLALDGANYRSFKGEATTNLVRNVRDFSGTQYGSSDEWTSSPTVLTKTYVSSIKTPIGNGATLIQESGTAGYHHLSRYGGGDENGLHSISCYVYPISSGITNFTFGLLSDSGNRITFDLDALTITYGGGISNRNAFITPVIGYDGWYRVGANIEGRSGGWVGCIGYSPWLSYTGTSGAKQCYITGIQYEAKSSPTSFVEAQTTRGTTVATGGGWEDLTGNGNNVELVNGVRESADNLGSLSFDGTNDVVNGNTTAIDRSNGQEITVSCWIKPSRTSGQYSVFCTNRSNNASLYNWIFYQHTTDGAISFHGAAQYKSSYVPTINVWINVTNTVTSSGVSTLYINGVSTYVVTGYSYGNSTSIGRLGIGADPGGQEPFLGNIAQVKIYNRALTANEVKQNFNATRSRFGI